MENKKILESWKEIAVYLNRSETTCRRLEQELGLPVHRLEETPKARVFAYKEEIDRWIKETQHSEKEIPIEKSFIKKLFFPATVVLRMTIIARFPYSRKNPLLLFCISKTAPGILALISGAVPLQNH